MKGPSHGFTLLEVLIALALVAVVLGGSMGVVRESITTQGHLEHRMLAEWAVSNVLDQYLLEHPQLAVDTRQGKETLLGRTFDYVVQVRKLAAPPTRGLSDTPGDGDVAPPPEFSIVVEIRDGDKRRAALARIERQRRGVAAG